MVKNLGKEPVLGVGGVGVGVPISDEVSLYVILTEFRQDLRAFTYKNKKPPPNLTILCTSAIKAVLSTLEIAGSNNLLSNLS